MASHSIWNGSISFGLVTIPVSLRTAVEDHDLKFSLLSKDDLDPVGYQHINKRTKDEVAWADIVKGYQYKKGKYVVLSPEDFTKANVKANQLLEIEDFVDLSEVDPIYFDKPYYVVPTEQGTRAYRLLRDVLARTGKIGIGRVVMHTKQHVVAIVPMGEVLLLEVLRFAHEVRPVKDLDLPADKARAKVTERELAMAEQLVSGLSSKWKPEKYKDTYHDDLLRLIEKKIKLGKTAEVEPYNEPTKDETGSGKVLDLMPLLKASLSRSAGHAGAADRDKDKDDEDENDDAQDAKPARKKSGGSEITPIARARKKAAAKTTAKRTSGAAKKSAGTKAKAKGNAAKGKTSARKTGTKAAPRRRAAAR